MNKTLYKISVCTALSGLKKWFKDVPNVAEKLAGNTYIATYNEHQGTYTISPYHNKGVNAWTIHRDYVSKQDYSESKND